jgi:hypothetical protein
MIINILNTFLMLLYLNLSMLLLFKKKKKKILMTTGTLLFFINLFLFYINCYSIWIQVKRKFSSFFKSLVIELDKDLYGPDNHLVEWHRTLTTQETDGFQVKRPGDKNVRCTILLLLDYQPLQVLNINF